MRPETFPEADLDLQRPRGWTEAECGPLPVRRDAEKGRTISLWKASWRERLSILLFGRVWLYVSAGGRTQPPVALSGTRNAFEKPTEVERPT